MRLKTGGIILKIRYSGILLIVLVTVALAVSGCSGSNMGGTVTPTVQPGSTTVTPAPTVTGATGTPAPAGAMTLSDLYSKGKFSWLEYTTTMNVQGQTMTSTMKMEMLGREMHEGKMMDHTRLTVNGNAQDIWSDPNAPTNSSNADFTSSKAVLTNAGTDSVTVNGKTYACTKYTVTMTSDSQSIPYTYWMSSQAPAPVQYQFTTEGMTSTTQLTGWG